MRSRWVVAVAVCVAVLTGCGGEGCAGTDDQPEQIEDTYLGHQARPGGQSRGG